MAGQSQIAIKLLSFLYYSIRVFPPLFFFARTVSVSNSEGSEGRTLLGGDSYEELYIFFVAFSHLFV